MSGDVFEEFLQLVKKNLGKNGFPQKSVSFPLERMYEEADKRGFSFNKVRDTLRGVGIDSELVGERVVFSQKVEDDGFAGGDFSDMHAMAQEMLKKMSPEEREKVLKMVQDMDPAQMESARKHWESLSPEEKRRAMQEMRKGG